MVAAASRAQANGKSPIQSIFQMYFGGLEAMGQAYDPFTKGIARAQLEAMGLMSRRAQAYMEIPARLSQCRTPQDLLNEQMRFWQTALEEYSESTRRITEAMASFAVPSFGFAQYGDAARSAHDYITFPETPAAPVRDGSSRERKAA
jgi:Phasin protein